MNIAIFLSGRVFSKNAKKNVKYLQDFKMTTNIKFFCSLNQETNDEFTKDFCNALGITDECVNIESTPINNEIFNCRKRPETNYENTYSMFYHNQRCIELINNYENKNDMLFDVIIKYRGDIISDEFMTILEPKNNTIYIPRGKDYGGINDQIAYGNKESMVLYTQCVNNIIDYCKNKIIYHPESLLLHHLKINNLNIIRFDYTYEINN